MSTLQELAAASITEETLGNLTLASQCHDEEVLINRRVLICLVAAVRVARSESSSLRAEVERLRGALGAAVTYLGEQEWSAWRSSDGGRNDFVGAACCIECAGMEADGHESYCRLADLLASLRALSSQRRTTDTNSSKEG